MLTNVISSVDANQTQNTKDIWDCQYDTSDVEEDNDTNEEESSEEEEGSGDGSYYDEESGEEEETNPDLIDPMEKIMNEK